ncbi:MAG TPA: glycosyltransferase [Sphingobacteriaceae bacterium]
MKLVFFTHPDFLEHQSMPRFARILVRGMRDRGHDVEVWSPKAIFSRLPVPPALKKWLGYADQFLLFPFTVRKRLRHCPADTLFVFTDQALGPWFPLVSGRPHVFHCHDFLAQRSALGGIPENPTGWTGRKYQEIIRKGFCRGSYFISVSGATQADLHQALPVQPRISEVVYNALDPAFRPTDPAKARSILSKHTGLDLHRGYLLHIGGNQWNKNRAGVVEIYQAWRTLSGRRLPLILIGEQPAPELSGYLETSSFSADIRLIGQAGDELVRMAYSGAAGLLFPSLAEGFGWPVAEAMACGCPVITTGEAPMTEVAGKAGFYIPRRPRENSRIGDWARTSAQIVEQVVSLSGPERAQVILSGLKNAERFQAGPILNRVESIYREVLAPSSRPRLH